jgi:hypothetical protein
MAILGNFWASLGDLGHFLVALGNFGQFWVIFRRVWVILCDFVLFGKKIWVILGDLC